MELIKNHTGNTKNSLYLIIPAIEFRDVLQALLEGGHILLNCKISSFEELIMFRDEMEDWEDEVAEFLKRSFNNRMNDYYLEFVYRPRRFIKKKKLPLNELVISTKYRINKDIAKLERMRVKILNIREEPIKPRSQNGFMKEKLRKLISEGKTKEGIEKLLNIFKDRKNESILNQIILLSNRYHDLRTKERVGLISSENADLKENKVIMGLLELIEKEI